MKNYIVKHTDTHTNVYHNEDCVHYGNIPSISFAKDIVGSHAFMDFCYGLEDGEDTLYDMDKDEFLIGEYNPLRMVQFKFVLSMFFDKMKYPLNKYKGKQSFVKHADRTSTISVEFEDDPDIKLYYIQIKKEYGKLVLETPSFKVSFRCITNERVSFPITEDHLGLIYENDREEEIINKDTYEADLYKIYSKYSTVPSKYHTIEDQLKFIKLAPQLIEYIDNPSEEIQLEAVSKMTYAIQCIDKPSEKVQMSAVEKNGYCIRFIKNPSECVQRAAIKQYQYALEYIENASEELQLESIKLSPYNIKYIDTSLRDRAAEITPNIIGFLKKPSQRLINKYFEHPDLNQHSGWKCFNHSTDVVVKTYLALKFGFN